jgi:hypothetical protein
MDKRLKIVHLKVTNTDFMYRTSRTEIGRLQAIEILRQQYINYKKEVQSRLQRVYTIVNQNQSAVPAGFSLNKFQNLKPLTVKPRR